MTSQESLVLDASVGVKWYRHERGSDDAYDILASARHGETRVAVPTHFVHEVLSVVRRDFRSSDVVPAWEQVTAAGIDIVPLTEEVGARPRSSVRSSVAPSTTRSPRRSPLCSAPRS
jgi:predicted nucleic acid-binding protein